MRRLALLFLVLGAAHAQGTGLDGEWTLVLERPGMQPRIQKGVLALERSGERWAGSLRFPMILFARKHALSDVRVKGSRLRFKIEHAQFTLEFEGKRKGAGLEGKCKWKGLGTYPWTAARPGAAEPQARFEKGLRFERDLPRIGLLVARGGRWGKKTLFPAEWIVTLGGKPGSPHNERCGLIWWRLRDPDGYYHDGWLGQVLLIYPQEDLVAVRLRAWDGSEAPEHGFGGLSALVTAAAGR